LLCFSQEFVFTFNVSTKSFSLLGSILGSGNQNSKVFSSTRALISCFYVDVMNIILWKPSVVQCRSIKHGHRKSTPIKKGSTSYNLRGKFWNSVGPLAPSSTQAGTTRPPRPQLLHPQHLPILHFHPWDFLLFHPGLYAM